MEVGAVFGLNNFKAIWCGQNLWHPVAIILRQGGNASIFAGRTPQVFRPLIGHSIGKHFRLLCHDLLWRAFGEFSCSILHRSAN
jgi:hypothetical protein